MNGFVAFSCGDCRRQSDLASRAHRFDFAQALGGRRVAGLSVDGEACVRQRIFVARVKPRVVGQSRDPLQRGVHLLGRAFEQPAAAHREQGVADEGDPRLVEHQGDMAERVAGDLDRPADMVAEAKLGPFAERDVVARRFGGAQDDGAGRLLDRQIAVGVVPMLVGVPHLPDRPAAPIGFGERGRGIAGIDDRGLAAVGVVDQPDVIVAQGRDRDDLKLRLHHSLPR